jgi:hypothetical protein
MPGGLRRAMKANAKGMPAKFEATPLKVIKLERINRGSPPRMEEYAKMKPKMPPPNAVTTLILILIQYAPNT